MRRVGGGVVKQKSPLWEGNGYFLKQLFLIIYNFLTCTWLVGQSVGGFVCLCVCLSDMGDLSQQV